MIKPSIHYVWDLDFWICEILFEQGMDERFWEALPVGAGDTPEKAFTDWYIKQIGADEATECQCNLL